MPTLDQLRAAATEPREKLTGFEAVVAAAWDRTTDHGDWRQLTPQWRRYLLGTLHHLKTEDSVERAFNRAAHTTWARIPRRWQAEILQLVTELRRTSSWAA